MRKFWIISFTLFMAIGSCIDPIKLDVDTEEGLIVVEGGITDQEGPYVINLFRSVNLYNDLEKRPAVTGAFVYVIDSDGNKVRFKDDVPGIFVSPAGYKSEYGKSYTLRIEAFDGKIYESEPQTLLPVDEIDSVYFAFEDKIDTGPPGSENNAGFNIYVNSKVTTAASYVRWTITGVYEVFTFPERHTTRDPMGNVIPDPLPCSGWRYTTNGGLQQLGICQCCNCWVTQYGRVPEVADVDFFGGNISGYKVGYVPATKQFFYTKYKVEVQQSSVSKEVYDYWKLVKVQKEGGSSLFQPASAKIKGNVKCINDAEAEIFGLFSVSSIKRKTLFIDKDDIPYKLLPIDSLANDCRFSYDNSTIVRPSDW